MEKNTKDMGKYLQKAVRQAKAKLKEVCTNMISHTPLQNLME